MNNMLEKVNTKSSIGNWGGRHKTMERKKNYWVQELQSRNFTNDFFEVLKFYLGC